MKKLLSMAVCAILMFALASCSGGGGKCGKLLATVPSDAQMVAVLNVEKIMEQTDTKVNGGSVDYSPAMKSFLAKAGHNGEQKLTKWLLSSGIDTECALLFMYQGNLYICGNVGDEKSFRSYIEESEKEKFHAEGELEVCGEVALKGGMFWVTERMDVSAIAGFTSLNEKNSMVSTAYASTLASMKHDVEGVVNINILQMSAQGTMAQLGIAAAFADARYFSFNIDSSKGEMAATMQILNSSFEPAKSSIKLAKVDMRVLKNLKGTPAIVMALAVDADMLGQLDNIPASGFNPMVSMFMSVLKNLDGTIALSFTIPTSDRVEVYGIAECKSKDAAQQVSGVINALGVQAGLQTSVEGKKVIISSIPSTAPTISMDGLSECKGATFALVAGKKAFASLASQGRISGSLPIASAMASIGPDGKSVEAKVMLNTSDSSTTGLEALLELMAHLQ